MTGAGLGPRDLPARRHIAPARAQRGLVFYAFVVITLFAMAALLWSRVFWQEDRAQRDQRILQLARDAVLAHLAAPDLDAAPGRRLGQLGFMPDLAFTGLGAAINLCAYRAWVPGQALTPVDTTGAAARCFGRLPWLSLGVDLGPVDAVDLEGKIPWLIVSPNLAASKNCMPNLTPLVIGSAVANTCPGVPSQLPFPWLTVVDVRGNVLTNRAAFALVLPGPPTNGQLRTLAAGPNAWLASLTVLPGCPAPCQPGTYDNSKYNQANGVATTLVTTTLPRGALEHLTWVADPHDFNNRVLWVSVDELFAYLQTRARAQLDNALLAFKAGNGYYPYAATFNQFNGTCTSGTRFGHPPVINGGGCTALAMPQWWIDAAWFQYFVYAVSPTCVAASHACGAPGLTVTPTTGAATGGVNAALIEPGTPIRAFPFAPSRGAPQAPLTLGVLSAAAADYVDSIANANGGATGIFAAVAPGTAVDDDLLYIVQ
ncbi:hypothetical protein SBBP1_20026 [Burkholderiales bacterium]|nr:hypothetical protein SBBP1_20026 [Burkholderiales bacterium]